MFDQLYSQYIEIISSNLFSRTATFFILIFTSLTFLLTILQIFYNWWKNKPSIAIIIQSVDVTSFPKQGDAKELVLRINLNIINNSKKANSIHTRILKLEKAKREIKSLYAVTIPSETPLPVTFPQIAFVLPNETPQRQYKLNVSLIDQRNKHYSSNAIVKIPEVYLS